MPHTTTPHEEQQGEFHIQLEDANISLQAAAREGARIKVRVELQQPDQPLHHTKTFLFSNGQWQEQLPLRPRLAQRWQQFSAWLTWDKALLALALLVYLLTRLIRITDFPIFFFTDEAIQTLLASDLIRDGLKGYDGVVLPTYFSNDGKYSLGASVYLQVLPTLLFERSILATRTTAALATLLAAGSLYLILKKVFHSQAAWLGILLLAATPVWFLHSRTAFETCLAASFYAAFLYFYLRYRTDRPNYLYPAVVMAALAFYSYNPVRVVVAVTAALLLLSDLRYHWQQRKVVLIGLGLTALMALPYLRFTLTHPGEGLRHLQIIHAYWFQPLPLLEKLRRFAGEYFQGLNPVYWYLPGKDELPRHVMKGYGHLLWASLPLMLAGLVITLRKFQNPAHRAILITLLAAPSGAALVGLGTTRSMTIVIPHVLLCTLATSAALDWLAEHRRWPRLALNLSVFSLLTIFSFWMLADALVNGPLWFQDYSLTGMQYGAKQMFGAVQQTLANDPDQEISVSASWANGADIIARFMLGDDSPVTIESIYSYLDAYKDLSPQRLFVMSPEEYQTALNSEKLTGFEVQRIIPYPNGKPGFYLVRLHYVDEIERVFEEERQALYTMQPTSLVSSTREAEVLHQALDMGELFHLFDNDLNTFIRSAAANPLVLQFHFVQPVNVSGAELRIGGAPTDIILQAYDADGNLLEEISRSYPAVPDPRTVALDFSTELQAPQLHFSVKNADQEEPSHVHIWEITLK